MVSSRDSGISPPGEGRAGQPAREAGPARRGAPAGAAGRGRADSALTRALGWASAAGITAAIAIMLAVAAGGHSRAVVRTGPASAFPPWSVMLRLPAGPVTIALWMATVVGGAAVAAGLAAVARGARPPARLLVVGALLIVAAFTVTPAAGSTDTLDYAAYGRMVAIGHDPYVMTPVMLKRAGDPVGRVAPRTWSHMHSVYGPLATVEQAAAAELGGASAARIIFWLKLWNGLAFAAVVLALDQLLRADPARRVRAHLWWSLNPVLLWGLVAGGHIDALAAAAGLLGLALLAAPGVAGGPALRGGSGRATPGLARAAAAGAMVGAAADIKITYALFGLGIAWAARRSPRTIAAAAGGALAVIVPSYAWFGPPAVEVLLHRDASATTDNFYQVLSRPFGLAHLPGLTLIAVLLFIVMGMLLLRRLPGGFPALPAAAPALALSLAWLLTWPYQRPWYDAMAICLLALYPASRLDWPVLARLTAASLFYLPGLPGRLPDWLASVSHEERLVVIPLVRFAALAAVLALALTGAWFARERSSSAIAGAGWDYAPSRAAARRAHARQAGRRDPGRRLQL